MHNVKQFRGNDKRGHFLPSAMGGVMKFSKGLATMALAMAVLATVNAQNALSWADGPYAGPNTRLGISVVAVWHITDHYGQIVEYLRMNGIVPPTTQQYPLAVR